MTKIAFAAAVLSLVVAATAADAAQIARPPKVLSPDLTDPWLVQIMPGKLLPRAKTPLLTRASLLPPRAADRSGAETQPTLVRIPGDPAPSKYPLAKEWQPQVVRYKTDEKPGTVIIDTPARHLYLVLDGGKALRYGVGVARPGFEWAGVHTVTRKEEWPDWTPPEEMLQRQPNLPRHMDGGADNPLGARALYLGSTLYRIHGSNEPWTIGHAVSSGCIRMRNQDVEDLYSRVGVGTKVVVI